MKKIKIDSNYILMGVFLLITGMVFGISIGMGGTFALEGSAMATSASATSVNATAANATATNATPVNATAANATSANASRTDNIIYLNAFSLAVESAKPSERVYVGKMTTGACNSGMSIYFINATDGTSFYVNVEGMNDRPYFVVPKNTAAGQYNAAGVTLIGLNSDGSTFSKTYGFSKYVGVPSAGTILVDFDVSLKIVKDVVKELKLDKVELTEKEALIGEKVNVTYSASDKLTSLRLFFKNGEQTFSAMVLDLGGKAYFNIPSTVKALEYDLVKAVAETEDASVVVTDTNVIGAKLTVKDNEKKTYIYNNSEITEEIIKKLYDDPEITEITVNTDENTVISADLFKAIIGTGRVLRINTNGNQWVFNGRDVNNAKSIDAHMTTNITADDYELSEKVNDGVVVNFVSNGTLPGNALVRIKVTDTMKSKFGNGRVYVYYYDNVEGKFNVIANGITPKDGYYEFAISHNSKYLITKTKLADTMISEEEDNNVVNFRQSNNTYLMMLVGALILILVVIVIVLAVKNKKGKN